jgi:hypothetical protein
MANDLSRAPGIHASQGFDQELIDLYGHLLDEDLPLGALIGSVNLVECVTNSRSKWAIRGEWHWILTEPKQLVRPRPMKGQLGLWDT